MRAHPRGSGRGVHRKQRLRGIQEIRRIARDLERRERPGACMRRNVLQILCRHVIEQLNVAVFRRVPRSLLLQQLDHHVVRGLVNERDQHILTIDHIGAVLVFRRCRLRNLPDPVPGHHIRDLVTQLFHQRLVDVQRLGAPHEGQRILRSFDHAFFQERRDHVLTGRTVELQLAPRQTVLRVRHEFIQRHHCIRPLEIGRNVVRVRDRHIRCGAGRNVRDDIVVDLPVIRIQLHLHLDVRIQRLEIPDRLLVHRRLVFIRVIFRPERDFNGLRLIQRVRDLELRRLMRPVARRQQHRHAQTGCCRSEFFHEPFHSANPVLSPVTFPVRRLPILSRPADPCLSHTAETERGRDRVPVSSGNRYTMRGLIPWFLPGPRRT